MIEAIPPHAINKAHGVHVRVEATTQTKRDWIYGHPYTDNVITNDEEHRGGAGTEYI